MAVTRVCRFLGITGLVFVVLPQITAGLLSDFKICGDAACESPMSRVQAIREHRGKDCRFLSFKAGESISVYHKLTGKREDLWAGSIDKQFGYFPKDAVEEDQVYTTAEKIVETQKSDFFCMDGNSYPTDSSDLDSDDENDDHEIQIQESESTQNIPQVDDTNSEPSTELPTSLQKSGSATTERDENKNAGESQHTNPAALSEQGGSPSSSSLGSSITGWFRLGNEEESGNLAEEEKEDEGKETQDKPSLTSSVIGWLGFGEQSEPDDAVKKIENVEETGDSLTSTMTGWLGFGGQTKMEPEKREQDGEREMEEETESQVKFRSRRMSLDLEGSQLHEEEKKEMGTLEWLGNMLSDSRKDRVLPADAAAMVDQKEASPQTKLDERSQRVGGMMDKESSAEMEGRQEVKSAGYEGEDINREPKEEEIKTASNNDLDFLIQSDIKPELSSLDSNLDSTGQSESPRQAEEDQLQSKTTGSGNKEGAETMSTETGASGDDHGDKGSDEGAGVLHTDISVTQINESAEQSQGNDDAEESSRKNLPFLSSGTAEERNAPVHREEERSTAEADNLDTIALTDDRMESETHHSEFGNERDVESVEDSSQGFGLFQSGNSPEEDGDTLPSMESTKQMENRDQESSQRVTDGEGDSESIQETERKKQEIDMVKEEEKIEEVEEVKEETQQEEVELKQEEREEVESVKEERKVEEVEIMKTEVREDEEVEMIKTEERKEEVEMIKTEEMKEEGVEVIKTEERKDEEMKMIKTEEMKEEGVEVIKKEERKEDEVEIMKTENKKEEEVIKTEERKEIKTEERKEEEVEIIKTEEKKEEEVEMIKTEEKKEEEVEIMKAEEKKEEEVEMIKTEEKKEEEVKIMKTENRKEEEVIKTEERKEIKTEERKEEEVEMIKTEEKKEEEVEIMKAEEMKEEEVEMIKTEEKKEEEVEIMKAEEMKEEEVEMIKTEEKKEEEVEMIKTENRKEEEVEIIKTEESKEEVIKTEEKKEEEVEMIKTENRKEEEVEIIKTEESKEEVIKTEEKKEEEVEMIKTEEIKEIKTEERKEKELEMIKMEEKRGGVVEVKEEKRELEGLQEEEKREEVEEPKDENKGEQDMQDELQEVNEKEKMEGVEKQVESSHVEEQNIIRPESGNSEKETEKTQTEEDEKVQDVEEEKQQIVQIQQVKEEEENLTCLNKLCPQATDYESVRDGNDNVSEDGSSSADETVQIRNQYDPTLPDGTGEVQKAPPEGAETGRVRPEGGGLTADRIEDNDLSHSGESGPQNELSLGRTAENREGDELFPGQTLDPDLYQENITKPGRTEANSPGVFTEETPERIDGNQRAEIEEDVYEMRHKESTDSQSNDNEESRGEERPAPPDQSAENQAVTSEQSVLHSTSSSLSSGDHNERTAETVNEGTFGFFKNTFSFFRQTHVTETNESTDSAQNVDAKTDETPQPPVSRTPGQELDSITDPSQTYKPDLHTEQPQQSRSTDEFQTSAPSQSHAEPPSRNIETPLQTKTLSKSYKNLPSYLSEDDTAMLMEAFGRHKLQFLDFMLESSEIVTEDPDHDESILGDIERLLQYHREALVPPSTKLTVAPEEDREKTRMLSALLKLEMLITRLRETFNTGKSHTSKEKHQAEASCVGVSCSTSKTTEGISSKTEDASVALDSKSEEKDPRNEEESVALEVVVKQILDSVHQVAEKATAHVTAAKELLWFTVKVVSSLPDDIRPGPDLYGLPWEPVIISSLVGLVTVLLFTCRCYSSVKSRMYRSKERWMAEQVAQLLDEKCKVLETLSKCQQEYDDLENSLRDSGALAQTQKAEDLEIKARQLGVAKNDLEVDLEQLKDQLDQQKEHRMEQERRIAVLEESMKTFEEESKELQSQEEQAQTTLKVYSMNSERLQRNLETAGEENTLLQESNAQLRQQVEGWAERVSELEEEMRRCEVAHSGMQQDVANKDERIMSLTDRLLRMKAWDSDLEEEGEEGAEKESSNGAPGKEEENGRGDITDTQGHFQKVQKLIYAAKLNADLKSVDEDKDRVFAKLNDEVKAKEDLQLGIKELENEKLSLQSDAEHYTDQVQRLQQKLQIMTEMYQENELKLHRLLTVEEKERLQKEEKLNKADKNIAMAMEELNNYRHRAEEMEEELEKTKQSYQTQISAHEKKAHNNWLAARAADRDLADIRRENALLRQKLTDTQFKLDALDKDPYALDSLARPLPFRAERSPYGPSPLGRPASETRAFLSPPTLMDGPPARLSPRVGRGPMEPTGGQGEMDRSGGPHSDSGSISPTWERDRRGPMPGPPGPLGPPGYLFPEPGGPMYRRPAPPPGALGILPPPGSLPPGPPLPHPRGLPPAGPPRPPHPTDIADGTYRENSLGSGEHEHREAGPGDRRSPPDADPRIGGPPPPGPPMGPIDGPFSRRAPYGPPPPDYYPPRGPGGPPMMPMWAPPPPGMMPPPRFPPGGPPGPHPHYGTPMRPLPPDGLPPPSMGPPPLQQSLPCPPQSQSMEEHRPSPEDTI